MRLDDRDSMRERNRSTFERMTAQRERPFTPPDDGPPFVLKVLGWVCMAFVVYKAWSFWEAAKAARHIASTPAQVFQQPVRSTPVAPAAATPAPAPVPQATHALPIVPDTEVVREPVSSRTSGTIYLCKDYSGGTFWASNHCNQHNALIDRIVTVPQGMPFERQVQIAEQRRSVLAAESPVQVTVNAPPAPVLNNKSLCESLNARVDSLDAMARQPQSGAMQDWIRSERQKTRDEQFRLHC